jgi:glycosyltransferase involved in cell wall biosynthesis
MLTAHNWLGTWRNGVHTYLALSEFSKRKFVEGGLPAEKIRVKPNFLSQDPGCGDGSGGYALFAGRLAKEKGLGVLVDAWARLRIPIPLKIAGDGDLMPWLRERSASLPQVEILGHCDRATILGMLKGARLLIMPSEWYEAGVPLTIIEAFACGTPVITSELPSTDGVIVDGQNGRRFPIGAAEALAERVESLWSCPGLPLKMRQAARATYEEVFTSTANYPILMNIYENALGTYSCGNRETASK